jgi:uncharacterized protein (DUF433 family)
MSQMDWRNWIFSDPQICAGKPCIKGTRIPVELVLDKLAIGEDFQEVLQAHPRLTKEGIQAALAFASENLKADVIYPSSKVAV